MPRADLVSIVEAVYQVEESGEEAWLRTIIEQIRATIGRRHRGLYGLSYDASDVCAIRFSSLVMHDVTDPRLDRILRVDCPNIYRDPEIAEAVFRRTVYGPSTELPLGREMGKIHAKFAECNVHAVLGINGINVDGRGAHVGVLLERPQSPLEDDVLSRLSTHLGAAYRLRKRLAGGTALEQADAIIEPGGRVAHAVREAKVKSARSALANAAARLDRLRGGAQRRDPERALRSWRALVDARWSLVDHFEQDGRRYVLAQRNDASIAPLDLLSDRERQVVALAALGHPNKMIAYELGIAVSTVGVLLGRAARRVGARTRADLVAAYARQVHANDAEVE